jgi:hypothetical protein
MAASDLLLLGYDDLGLAALSHSFEIEPGKVKILAMARALRCKGLGFGDLVMDETLERIPSKFDSVPGEDYIVVEGVVHRENALSQALLDRQHFFYYGDDGVEQDWFLRIDLAEQE